MPSIALHHYLRPLVTPASVALVGASERPGSIGRILLKNILGSPFQGELHVVNPGHSMVLGRKCHPSLSAIGKPVERITISTARA